MKVRRSLVIPALLIAVALMGSACKKAPVVTGPKQESGGTLIFGAEQWPECLNVITSCANASWLNYTAANPTIPGLLTLNAANDYVASPLVKRVPSVENGGVVQSPFSVTFDLDPNAVWEDGTKITGEDIKFTWQAYLKTPDALTTEGYDKITDITITGNKVKITFSSPYAPWKTLFGFILESKTFNGDPNVTGKMQTSYGFAGGPFKVDSFTDSEMVLSRNEKFWGKKAFLDKVIFRKIEDSTAEVTSFKTGEIDAFFPQPTVELIDQIKAIPGGEISVKGGTVFEGLWFNLDKEPVKNREVREALLYGLNRQAAITAIVKPIDPKAVVNQCLFSVPNLADGKYCPKDFPAKQDVARAKKALEDAGWVKGADGIYAKGGKRLSIKFATTAGNKGREATQQILLAQAKEIGIELVTDNSPAGVLFQTRLPARDFVMAEFAQVATPDPTITANFAKDQIPTKANPDGANYYGWANDEATALMKQSDVEVDDVKRTALMAKIGALAFKDIASIPFFSKPQILVYNSNKLLGDFDFNAGQAGFSAQLATWSLKRTGTAG